MNDGKQGEYLARKCLEANGFTVKDVSNNSDYWKQDVDLLAEKQGRLYKIEVKWDDVIAESGCFFFEVITDIDRNKQGWAKYTEADYIFYGDAQQKIFYVFSADDMRDCINAQGQNYYKIAQDFYKKSAGVLVNVCDFENEYPTQEIFIQERLAPQF